MIVSLSSEASQCKINGLQIDSSMNKCEVYSFACVPLVFVVGVSRVAIDIGTTVLVETMILIVIIAAVLVTCRFIQRRHN